MKKIWDNIISWVVLTIGKIQWRYTGGLSEAELAHIYTLLVPNYYVIITHRKNHLSTFFVGLASFMVTGKWSYWAHALMNLEDDVDSKSDFRLIEATGSGVHYSPFSDVFNVHGVALLKPKNMSINHWTYVLDKAKKELGKPYDTLFDIKNDNALSCVELVRVALMNEPDYYINFPNFETMISNRKNLTPQMFYDCEDFEVIYEVRRTK